MDKSRDYHMAFITLAYLGNHLHLQTHAILPKSLLLSATCNSYSTYLGLARCPPSSPADKLPKAGRDWQTSDKLHNQASSFNPSANPTDRHHTPPSGQRLRRNRTDFPACVIRRHSSTFAHWWKFRPVAVEPCCARTMHPVRG
jgi:hypothetical protein